MFKKVLTNPSEHNPNDFIYLVHGLIDYGNNGITPEDVTGKIGKIGSANEFYRASMLGQMDEDSAKQRVGWHGELYRMFTFGNVGLILNPANDEDIKIAWYCGLGSPNEPEELKKFVEPLEYLLLLYLSILIHLFLQLYKITNQQSLKIKIQQFRYKHNTLNFYYFLF